MFQRLKEMLLSPESGKDNDDELFSANPKKRTSEWVKKLANISKYYDSPINIDINYMKRVQLSSLNWVNYNVEPKKLKITNTGHTIILSGKWYQERPYITSGPLDAKYVFSQLHFHWGETNEEGSEHTVDGKSYPLEMHVVHFKSSYLTQEHALKEKDGLCVLGYFFKVQKVPNTGMQDIIEALPFVHKAQQSAPLMTRPLDVIVKPFLEDYFMYWGSVSTSNCLHLLLWLFSREPIGISASQLETFRQLLDSNDDPIARNYRETIKSKFPQVFHVNPSKIQTLTVAKRGNYDNNTLSLYDIGGGSHSTL